MVTKHRVSTIWWKTTSQAADPTKTFSALTYKERTQENELFYNPFPYKCSYFPPKKLYIYLLTLVLDSDSNKVATRKELLDYMRTQERVPISHTDQFILSCIQARTEFRPNIGLPLVPAESRHR
jgi:hypothetical protein